MVFQDVREMVLEAGVEKSDYWQTKGEIGRTERFSTDVDRITWWRYLPEIVWCPYGDGSAASA